MSVGPGMVSTGLVTLVAGEVCTVSLEPNIMAVEIISDGQADVWYTVNNDKPTVGGVNCWRIPGQALSVDVRSLPNDWAVPTRVRLISTGTPTITVQRR